MALVSSALNITRYDRFLKKLYSGEGFSHHVPYRRALMFNTVWMAISFLGIFALLIGIKVSHDFPETRLSSADNGTYDLTHPLPLSEWDPESWAKIEPCLETNRWTENLHYIEDRYWDILFSDIQMIDAGRMANATTPPGIRPEAGPSRKSTFRRSCRNPQSPSSLQGRTTQGSWRMLSRSCCPI